MCLPQTHLESYARSPSPSLYVALLVKSTLQITSQLFHSSLSFAASFEVLKVSPQNLLANESENQIANNVLRGFLRWLLFQERKVCVGIKL